MPSDALADFVAACESDPVTQGPEMSDAEFAARRAEEEDALARAKHDPGARVTDVVADLEEAAEAGASLVPTAKEYVSAYNIREEARKALKVAEAEVDAYEDQLLTEMVAAEVPQFRVHGRTLFIQKRLYVRSATGDHAGLAQALLDAGRGDLIVVGPQKMKSEFKDDDAVAGMHPDVLAHLLIERVPRIGSRKAP